MNIKRGQDLKKNTISYPNPKTSNIEIFQVQPLIIDPTLLKIPYLINVAAHTCRYILCTHFVCVCAVFVLAVSKSKFLIYGPHHFFWKSSLSFFFHFYILSSLLAIVFRFFPNFFVFFSEMERKRSFGVRST